MPLLINCCKYVYAMFQNMDQLHNLYGSWKDEICWHNQPHQHHLPHHLSPVSLVLSHNFLYIQNSSLWPCNHSQESLSVNEPQQRLLVDVVHNSLQHQGLLHLVQNCLLHHNLLHDGHILLDVVRGNLLKITDNVCCTTRLCQEKFNCSWLGWTIVGGSALHLFQILLWKSNLLDGQWLQ